jgi:YD repeat-containing protein
MHRAFAFVRSIFAALHKYAVNAAKMLCPAKLLCSASSLFFCAQAFAVGYTYDELGRLKSVTDNAGNIAEYVYDALGNIKEIKQFPSGTLSITEFTPNAGPVGASITIWGGGFSATPASNTVKFNGTWVLASHPWNDVL